METTRTGKSSNSALISLMRSIPLVPPREISTMTTSGFIARMPRNALAASGASPHTVRPDSRSMSWRNPSRNMAWSSTMNTRLRSDASLAPEIFAGLSLVSSESLWAASCIDYSSQWFRGGRVKNTHDFRAAIDLALDIQSRPDDVGAIAHDTNAHAAAALAWQFESRPVVLDGQFQAVSVPGQGDDD